MFELIYASAESQPFSSEDLTALLAKARKNNQALGVSGLLLYHGGSFLQLLEGEVETVEALYRKIAQDPRHQRAVTIKRGDVAERAFAVCGTSKRSTLGGLQLEVIPPSRAAASIGVGVRMRVEHPLCAPQRAR